MNTTIGRNYRIQGGGAFKGQAPKAPSHTIEQKTLDQIGDRLQLSIKTDIESAGGMDIKSFLPGVKSLNAFPSSQSYDGKVHGEFTARGETEDGRGIEIERDVKLADRNLLLKSVGGLTSLVGYGVGFAGSLMGPVGKPIAKAGAAGFNLGQKMMHKEGEVNYEVRIYGDDHKYSQAATKGSPVSAEMVSDFEAMNNGGLGLLTQ